MGAGAGADPERALDVIAVAVRIVEGDGGPHEKSPAKKGY